MSYKYKHINVLDRKSSESKENKMRAKILVSLMCLYKTYYYFLGSFFNIYNNILGHIIATHRRKLRYSISKFLLLKIY